MIIVQIPSTCCVVVPETFPIEIEASLIENSVSCPAGGQHLIVARRVTATSFLFVKFFFFFFKKRKKFLFCRNWVNIFSYRLA